MTPFRHITKPVAYAVAAGMLAMSLHLPAQATLIGTEAVVHAAQAQQERSRIQDVLNRDDVKLKLTALGVDPAQVQARVDALTDEEVQRLAKQIDEMPAGGDGLSTVLDVALIVFLILLITDLLGLTDVFPFTKKGSARVNR